MIVEPKLTGRLYARFMSVTEKLTLLVILICGTLSCGLPWSYFDLCYLISVSQHAAPQQVLDNSYRDALICGVVSIAGRVQARSFGSDMWLV